MCSVSWFEWVFNLDYCLLDPAQCAQDSSELYAPVGDPPPRGVACLDLLLFLRQADEVRAAALSAMRKD